MAVFLNYFSEEIQIDYTNSAPNDFGSGIYRFWRIVDGGTFYYTRWMTYESEHILHMPIGSSTLNDSPNDGDGYYHSQAFQRHML